MKKTYRWDRDLLKLVETEKRIPEARVHIIPDIEPYVDDNMEHEPQYVKSRRHRRELLKERGLAIK